MEDSAKKPGLPCSDMEPLLILFSAGQELDPAEQAEVSEHLAHCADCAAFFTREKEMLALISSRHAEPDGGLLASCRAGLEDALDRQEERGWLRRFLGTLLPANWVSPRPAWSAALLVIIGFSVGILGPRFFDRVEKAAPPAANTAVTVDSGATAEKQPAAGSSLGTLDLHTADVAGINVLPAAANEQPQIELQLRAQRPVTLQGTVDNDDVKRVLLYVLQNNERFDPDVRLSAVDLLRERNNDPEVRSVLCQAVHSDRNAAVRLKALEALNGAEPQELVRDTLLHALVDDQNPGVRVEAINALRSMASKGQVTSDDHMLAVLRDRMQKDPNTYIRLQSAAAIRDLGPRAKF
ncbi:MAG TPA: HEAT repeat domain-containing protein [Candidatus Acidoferrum sp.]|nr:HEAT repeat domain-containing protein [Candidatus Acidoferrum sp.]